MTEIIINNTDWDVLDGIRMALVDASVGGSPVFQTVAVTTDKDQALECLFTGGAPRAVLRYVRTEEGGSGPGGAWLKVEMELSLADRVDRPRDQRLAVQRAMYLANAAGNAVTTALGASLAGRIAAAPVEAPINIGPARLDSHSNLPWVAATLSVVISIAASADLNR